MTLTALSGWSRSHELRFAGDLTPVLARSSDPSIVSGGSYALSSAEAHTSGSLEKHDQSHTHGGQSHSHGSFGFGADHTKSMIAEVLPSAIARSSDLTLVSKKKKPSGFASSCKHFVSSSLSYKRSWCFNLPAGTQSQVCPEIKSSKRAKSRRPVSPKTAS